MAFVLTLFDPDDRQRETMLVEFVITDDGRFECGCDIEAELAARELGFDSLPADVERLWRLNPVMVGVQIVRPIDSLRFATETMDRLAPLVKQYRPEDSEAYAALLFLANLVLDEPSMVQETYALDRFDMPQPAAFEQFDIPPEPSSMATQEGQIRYSLGYGIKGLTEAAQTFYANERRRPYSDEELQLEHDHFIGRVGICATAARISTSLAYGADAEQAEVCWQIKRPIALTLSDVKVRFFQVRLRPVMYGDRSDLEPFDCEGAVSWLSD